MLASGTHEHRSEPSLGRNLADHDVVFPLPGGRYVARSQWPPATLEEPTEADLSPASISTAERRRTLARRRTRPKLAVACGESVAPPPTLATGEPDPD
jgi:hypothetical protein